MEDDAANVIAEGGEQGVRGEAAEDVVAAAAAPAEEAVVHGDEEATEAAEEQGDDDAEGEQVQNLATQELDWVLDHSQCIVDEDVEIGVHRLQFDLMAKFGQPRTLSEAGVKQRLASLKTNPPSTP